MALELIKAFTQSFSCYPQMKCYKGFTRQTCHNKYSSSYNNIHDDLLKVISAHLHLIQTQYHIENKRRGLWPCTTPPDKTYHRDTCIN